MTKLMESKDLLEKYQNALNEVRSFFENNLGSMVSELMKQSPRLESVSFTAYTPWFNDGDSCVYSVHNIRWVNGINEYHDDSIVDLSINYLKQEELSKLNPEMVLDSQLVLKIQEILDSVPDNIAENIFGDHVKVTIDREGNIKTEEYEHD